MLATLWVWIIKIIAALLAFLIFNALWMWLWAKRRWKIYNSVLEKQWLQEYNWDLLDAFSKSIYYIFAFIGIYSCFSILGFKLSMVMTLIALAVSAVFKQIFADLWGLFVISLNKNYKIWNWIEFEERAIFDEDEQDYSYISDEAFKIVGKISDVTRRYVKIKTIDWRYTLLPNSFFTKWIIGIYDTIFQYRYKLTLGRDMRFDDLENELKQYFSKSPLWKYIEIENIKLMVDLRTPITASIEVLIQIKRDKLEYAKINYLTYKAELEKTIYQVVLNQWINYRLNYLNL